jgi:hypothetical protein
MRIVKFLLLAFAVAIAFSSCKKIKGKGDLVVETRTVTGYSGLELSMECKVIFTPGQDYSLKVEAQDNLMPYIETFAEGGHLVIRQKPNINFSNNLPITITVTAPESAGFWISGSGNIHVQGTWVGGSVETDISGSGNVFVQDLDVASYRVRISGSGNVECGTGYADSEDLNISGSGNIDLRNVIAERTTAIISGSGNIYTQVTIQLDATISGSGSIFYLGQPSVNVQISGSGKVQKL